MRMGYGGDKKGLGETLQEIDPTAKIPKFKVYGKNNTANELKEILKDQRLSQMKSKVKQSEYGFKLTDTEFNHSKPFSPFTDFDSLRNKNGKVMYTKVNSSLEKREGQ